VRCGGDSMKFASRLLDAGVVVTPGMGFGKYGEGYIRFSITQPKERIAEAVERLSKIL
ncbi:MAG: aspartate aminotransferase, partial [Candidatus Bathyarchaeota archaeon]|nr:aspartate aminotransferase [Candidatus Bathyarchaeota archaeon]